MYWNWIYQENPITGQTLVGFENTEDCTGELDQIQRAANKWDLDGCNFKFPLIQLGDNSDFVGIDHSDGENQIGWVQTVPPGYDENFLAISSILRQPTTNRILEVDTIFNDLADWNTESVVPDTKYDVQSAMVHEFGHWAGLHHTGAGGKKVMQPTLDKGEKRRKLQNDDEDGLFAIYTHTGWAGDRLTSNEELSIDPVVTIGKDHKDSPKAKGNTIHVAWADRTSGNYDIYYRRHLTGGNPNVAWKSPVQLTSNSGVSRHPDIASDRIYEDPNTFKDYVYLVWNDNSEGNNEIYFVRSKNGGDTWKTIRKLSDNIGDSISPAITVSGDHIIHVVWADNTPGINGGNVYNYEIFYTKSTDKGKNWSPEERLTETSSFGNMFALSKNPDIAADTNNHVHIVWRDNRYWEINNIEIFYKRSQEGPIPWTADKKITNSEHYSVAGGCFEPSIIVTDKDDYLHVVYTYEMPNTWNGDIWYLRSLDEGDTWGGDLNLSENEGYSKTSDINYGYIHYATDAKIYALSVVWQDDSPGEEEIYHSWSKTTGAEWEKSQLTSNNQDCYGVSVSVYQFNIHIVWSQILSPDSDHEIMYLRNMARF